MKKLVWLLVLFNIGLFAYYNLENIFPSPPKVVMESINPEKISLLTAAQIEALPKKSGGATPDRTPIAASPAPVVPATITPTISGATCYEWGVFSAAGLSAAQSKITSFALTATVKEHTPLEAKRFWVYKPPLKSAEVAQAKAAELKALGVGELYVLQDSKWKNAISFGVFEDEQLATNLLLELKAKGVREVVKAVRNQGKGQSSLLLGTLTEADVSNIKNLKSAFPEANLKEMACN